jgi:hypothetical protein
MNKGIKKKVKGRFKVNKFTGRKELKKKIKRGGALFQI